MSDQDQLDESLKSPPPDSGESQAGSQGDGVPTITSVKATRSRPNRSVPTSRIAFDKQLDMLRAAAAISGTGGKVVTNDEIGEMVDLKGNTVSLANGFFQEANLVEKKDGGIVPSQEVHSFARAYEWDADTAAHKLGPALRKAWFSLLLLPKLKFRPHTRADLIRTLAEETQASTEYEDRLGLILDFLEVAGVVDVEGSEVRLPEASRRAEAPKAPEERADPKPASKVPPVQPPPSSAEGAVQFHVSVKVDMAEFAGWQADRITAFFGGIAKVLAAKADVEEAKR